MWIVITSADRGAPYIATDETMAMAPTYGVVIQPSRCMMSTILSNANIAKDLHSTKSYEISSKH